MTLSVRAPLDGIAVEMGAVRDPVFSGELLGPGVAILPSAMASQDIHAPVDGILTKLFPHAFVLLPHEKPPILVHLGLDTVTLRGAGFELLRHEGDALRVGDPILTWTPQVTVDADLDPVVPIVVLNSARWNVDCVCTAGESVSVGDAVINVTASS